MGTRDEFEDFFFVRVVAIRVLDGPRRLHAERGLKELRNIRIDDHCGTVTPVVSLPHESVIVLVSKPLPMALRTGGSASSPIPADAPAATTTSYSCQKVLCFSASRFAIA